MTIQTQTATARLRLIPRSAVVSIRAGSAGDGRLRTRFDGREPTIRESGDTIAVEYPRFARPLSWQPGTAELRLDPSVAWEIEIEGGISGLVADLSAVPLRSLAVDGGASDVLLILPEPDGEVGLRIGGGASGVYVDRPVDAAARLLLGGGASRLSFDGRRFDALGGRTLLASPGAEEAADRYEIEVLGGASRLTVAGREGAASR